MPSIPDHSLKLRLAYAFNQRLGVGTNIVAYSDTYMMGNENNEHGNTGGDGKVPGYAIVNLDAKYQFNPEWSLDFKAINVFDKTYLHGWASFRLMGLLEMERLHVQVYFEARA